MAQKRPDRVRGPNHDDFWTFCDKGELRLQRCENCGHRPWPVVSACEHCGESAFSWDLMSGRGTVLSWCSFHHDYYRGAFSIPHDVILVALEEGPLLISNPSGFTEAEIGPDMPVKVEFLDCEDRGGAYKLPVFARG